MIFEEILALDPYSLDAKEKDRMLNERLVHLTRLHSEKCQEYNRILKCVGYDEKQVNSYKDLPFLPVRLFKELDLKSVSDNEVVKTMTSSGTTGQHVSKIYLDRTTSSNQQKAMVKIVSNYTGSARMPMIILDCPSVVKDRKMFSARGAGILGFSIFGTKKIYAFNDEMQLDVEGLRVFLDKHRGERILLFGFTFMVWQYFYKELVRLKTEGIQFDLSNGILIHGGGWKKLVSEAVSPKEFHDRLKDICRIDSVHDYYGMVEQTGCIYMQCECGHLHASGFSDIIIRNPLDWSECKIGEPGIIQVVSTIPESYPGHSLLTEDEGVVLGEDDCLCGRKGKYFKILGRIKNAEIRGCSDAFADKISQINANTVIDSINRRRNITYLVGNSDIVEKMSSISVRKPFAESIVAFMNDVSSKLLRDRNAKMYPDVVTLGFWLRKGNINHLKDRHYTSNINRMNNVEIRMGRGVLFHIAPSNVPVNYAYSLFTGLMCGNSNIVRIPSKPFPQVEIINKAICESLEEYPEVKPYIALVRYERDKSVNDYFSSLCDVRVIWGGDATIEEIRKSPLRARATEVTFADRYSIALINADEYVRNTLDCTDKKKISEIANDFYNDTYLTDQNACTSPKLIAWMGSDDNRSKAKVCFWNSVHRIVKEKYKLPNVSAVDKLTLKYIVATKFNVTEIIANDNSITRLEVNDPIRELMDYVGNSGYFYECTIENILELRDICNDTKCQTIEVLSDKGIIKLLIDSGIRGIDRVVNLGKTLDFDIIWDGYDLTNVFSRVIHIS